jgi:hypothetical protein
MIRLDEVNMIRLDKVKIMTSTKKIERFDESKFYRIEKEGKPPCYKYKQTSPYELLILINYERGELVIEFTSKILGLGFIDLINKDNICECLYSISPLVEFEEDVCCLLGEFEVLKCDVTKDVPHNDVKTLEDYVETNLANNKKWKCEHQKNGFVLKNVVGTPRYKKRIVVYDKAHELKLDRNRKFLNEVDDYDEGDSFIFDHFNGTVRIELNINTKVQVRDLLHIPDNRLVSVLNSDANPILDVLNEALKQSDENSSSVSSAWKEYKDVLVLKDCDNNLGKVENKIRSLTSSNTSITRMMKPYRELHQRLQNDSTPTFDLRKLVV